MLYSNPEAVTDRHNKIHIADSDGGGLSKSLGSQEFKGPYVELYTSVHTQ